MSKKNSRLIRDTYDAPVILSYISMTLFAILCVFPFYYIITVSISDPANVREGAMILWPKGFSLEAYRYLLKETNFMHSMRNSLIVAVVVSVFSIVIAYPVAYTLARLSFRGRKVFSKSVLFMYLLPTSVLYIPLYMLLAKLHLTNTIWGLVVIYPTFTLPYISWILIPHIADISRELEEAAEVDGCT